MGAVAAECCEMIEVAGAYGAGLGDAHHFREAAGPIVADLVLLVGRTLLNETACVLELNEPVALIEVRRFNWTLIELAKGSADLRECRRFGDYREESRRGPSDAPHALPECLSGLRHAEV